MNFHTWSEGVHLIAGFRFLFEACCDKFTLCEKVFRCSATPSYNPPHPSHFIPLFKISERS